MSNHITTTPKPKLLLVVPELDFGGIEMRLTLQCELLDRERFDVRVCTFWKEGAAASKLRKLGIPVDSLDVKPAIRNATATLSLWKYLRATKPDILHCRIAEANFHGMLAGAACGIPFRVAEEVGLSNPGIKRRIYGKVLGLAHRVVGVSDAVCKGLKRQDGVREEKIGRIYNTALPEFFEETQVTEKPVGSKYKILCVGRLVEMKNHEALLTAFSILSRKFENAELVIAGDGPLRSRLESLAEDLKVSQQVKFLGYRSDVRTLMDDADLFVLLSKSGEGFGNVFVEAMSRGVLVLGSTFPPFTEVIGSLGPEHQVRHSDISEIVAKMENLAKLSEKERRRRVAIGRRTAFEQFSPEKYMDNLSCLYNGSLPRWREGATT